VDEVKLKVFYVQPPSPGREEPEEGLSPHHSRSNVGDIYTQDVRTLTSCCLFHFIFFIKCFRCDWLFSRSGQQGKNNFTIDYSFFLRVKDYSWCQQYLICHHRKNIFTDLWMLLNKSEFFLKLTKFINLKLLTFLVGLTTLTWSIYHVFLTR
jgi:hypothetical protein